MTIKELAEVAGCNDRTVRRIGKKIYPSSFNNGIKTFFNETQAFEIMKRLPKKNIVETDGKTFNTLDTFDINMSKHEKVDYEIIGKMIGMAVSAAMQPVVNQLEKINKQPLQIEQVKQDYFSLVAYCNIKKIPAVNSELKKMGMDLRTMAKDKGKELHKIPDERYGQVNSYPVEILEEYFSL